MKATGSPMPSRTKHLLSDHHLFIVPLGAAWIIGISAGWHRAEDFIPVAVLAAILAELLERSWRRYDRKALQKYERERGIVARMKSARMKPGVERPEPPREAVLSGSPHLDASRAGVFSSDASPPAANCRMCRFPLDHATRPGPDRGENEFELDHLS